MMDANFGLNEKIARIAVIIQKTLSGDSNQKETVQFRSKQ